MASHALPFPPPFTSDRLDRLFLDCAELETLVTSIRQSIGELDPAVDSGLVTAEHVMNLAFRIENAEHGLIAIARQIGDTATTLIERRKAAMPLDTTGRTTVVAPMAGSAKN
ncbi:MAG: hypothetical protein ACR2RA_16580 [Geminicoccaceae bacterium]